MRARTKTFVWRGVARTTKPRSVPLAPHGSDRRYSKYGCRCRECKNGRRVRQNRYRAVQRDQKLLAFGAIDLVPRVRVADFQAVTVSCITAYRIGQFARRHGITKTQAADIVINRALDAAIQRPNPGHVKQAA